MALNAQNQNITSTILDARKSQNTITTTDSSHEWATKSVVINEDNYFISIDTANYLDGVIDILATYVTPIVACFSLIFTILCILILIKPLFKGSLYKYLLFNSIFDTILLSLVALKPVLEQILTENIHELFGFIYFTSALLTCSNLTKFFYSFDRLSKMTGKNKWFYKRSHNLVIAYYTIFGCIICIPVLISHDILEFKWFKMTYYELVLNEYAEVTNSLKTLGMFTMVLAIVLDVSFFMVILILNKLIKSAIDKNTQTLNQMIENDRNKAKEFVIQIYDDLHDANEYEDDEANEIELDKISIKSLSKDIEQQDKHETDTNSVDTKNSLKTHIDYEIARKRLSNLIVVINKGYLFGHLLFVFSNIYQKVVYYMYGPIKLTISYNYYAYLDLLNAVANILLYLSFSFNFFIYFYYNRKFKYAVEVAYQRLFKCLCCLQMMAQKQTKSELFKK